MTLINDEQTELIKVFGDKMAQFAETYGPQFTDAFF